MVEDKATGRPPETIKMATSLTLQHPRCNEKIINTTSKLGLPSDTLLRNQHGQTRRKRHNKKRKQHTHDETDTTTIESRMWSIQAAVAYLRARSVRTLRDPATSSCEVSSHLEKMHLVIEHNHQSFEQLGTSSRDIGSRKSEASSSCRGKHNHFEPVE
jgi:hypothetical protein